MGLRPTFNESGVITGFTEDPAVAEATRLERELGLGTLRGQLELQPLQQQQLRQALGLGEMQMQQMRELGPLQLQTMRQQLQQQQELMPLQMQALREQMSMGREQFAFEKEMAMRQAGYTEAQIARQASIDAQVAAEQAEEKRMQGLVAPFAYEQMGLKAQMDPTGKIIGFEKITDPLEAQRQAVEAEYLTRTQKALRGELPVDPTLHRELAAQEQTLRETYRRQLGTGYETSTPGQEALARFGQAKAEALSGASRGELTLSEQMGLTREQVGQRQQELEKRGVVDIGTYLAGAAAQPRSELISLAGRGVSGGGAQGPSGQAFSAAAQLAANLGRGGGVQLPQVQIPSFGAMGGGGGGGGMPSSQARLQQLIGLTRMGGAGAGDIMGGIQNQLGTLGQWRGQSYQSQLAQAQQKQQETQMYAGMGAAGVSAAASIAAAAPAVFSSRQVKKDVRRLSRQEERSLRGQLSADED